MTPPQVSLVSDGNLFVHAMRPLYVFLLANFDSTYAVYDMKRWSFKYIKEKKD